MIELLQNNLVPVIVAVLVAIAVAFWVFRGNRSGAAKVEDRGEARTPRQVPRDGAEGNSVPDEFSAAARDVAGEFLGVDAHPVVPGAEGPPDDLQTMKGVGPKLAAQPNACRITRFEQLARLSPNEVTMVDARMGPFRGRIERDRL